MNALTSLRGRKLNLVALLPVLMIAMALAGSAMLVITSLLPQWKLHEDLATQVASGRDAIVNKQAQQSQQNTLKTLRGQIASVQTQLEDASGPFFTDIQADAIPNKLYTYAEVSGVKISSLQSQPAASTGKKTVFDIRSFRLQVDGSIARLVNFLSRIREASSPGVSITSLTITKGPQQESLGMTLQVYTSPYASGKAMDAVALVNTPSPVPPTFTPTSTMTPSETPTPSLTPSRTPTLTFTPTNTATPTFTLTPTLSPTPTTVPPTLTPTIAPTLPGQCSNPATDTLHELIFAQSQDATVTCQIQVWNYVLNQSQKSYKYELEVQRKSGDGLFRLELRDQNNNLISSAQSSSDGHGLLEAESGPGSYVVQVVPIRATAEWAYSITIWKEILQLTPGQKQTSFSSHSSVDTQKDITTWRYSVTAASQALKVDIIRVDGNVEYSVSFVDSTGKPVASGKSEGGKLSLPVTAKKGNYLIMVNATSGTSGTYQITVSQ